MKRIYLLGISLLLSLHTFAQTPGLIYKSAGSGTSVLDPNGDGYTSETSAGFSVDDHAESEIKYKPLVVPAVEPVADPGPGPDCAFNDIVDSGDEDPVFSYFDGTNLLFRFRLGGSAPNSKGYSVMIDTDQKFGFTGPNADPNAVSGNPGFEMEIVLRTNFDVKIYNVDGTTSPIERASYAYDNYAQKSIALTTNCGNADYFYDFFVPFSGITSNFPGITASTPLRMVAVTSMNPAAAIGNNAVSDVGGIDDQAAGYNFDLIFQNIVDNYTPTSVTDINTGPQDRSACPAIIGPISADATMVSGTSTEVDGTLIRVYNNELEVGTASVSGGNWTATVPAVDLGQIITATAQASGKGVSISNCSATTVTNCTAPTTPYNLTISSGRKLIQGSGIAGAILHVYTETGGVYTAAGSSITVLSDETFCWRLENTGASNCSTSGASDLSNTTYYVSQTVGGCESAKVPICVDNQVSATPVLTQSSINVNTTTLSGTRPSGAVIYVYADGVLIATVAETGTSWSATVDLSSRAEQYITVAAKDGTKCISVLTTRVLIQAVVAPTPVSTAPVISSASCGENGKYATIAGTSLEANGSKVYVYLGGSSTAAGTATVYNGTWATSVLLSGQTSATAKAEATGKTISAASSPFTIPYKAAAPSIVINNGNPVIEGVNSISGTTSTSGTLNVYLDGVLLGSTTDASWTISGLNATNFYAGGAITATIDNGSCESAETSPVTVQCLAPSQTLNITPSATTICADDGVTATVELSESGIIYQLYDGSSASGSARLGTGGDITLTSAALTTSATLGVKATKISPVSCVSTLNETVAVTVNPIISNNNITAPAQTDFCGEADPGEISGSLPTGGTDSYSYQWQNSTDNISFSDISGANDQHYHPPLTSVTTYFRRQVNSGGCENFSTSVAINIQATDLTNTITTPAMTTFCSGDNPDPVIGSLPTGGNGTFTYQWQSSTDNINFEDIGTGDTGKDYDPTSISSTTYLRRLVNSGTCTDHQSNVVKLEVASPATTTIIAAASSMLADGTSTTGITVQVKDATGNDLTAAACLPVLSTTAGTLSGLSYQGNGRYTATLTSSTTLGTTTISGTLNGATITDTEEVTFTTGVASIATTTITADPTSILADGISTSIITVQLKDAAGHSLTSSGGVVVLSTTAGTLSGVTDQGDGSYTATLTSSSSVETAEISGSLDGIMIDDEETVSFVAGPASIATTTISSENSSLVADGVSQTTITVQLKDAIGHDLTTNAGTVILVTSTGSLSTATYIGNGQYTATLTSSTSIETAEVSGTLDGIVIDDKASVDFVVGPASVVSSTITADETSILADGSSTTTITVQLKDATGHNLSADEATIVLVTSAGDMATAIYAGNGTYTAVLTSSSSLETAIISGTLNGVDISDTETVEFVVGVANTTTTTISTSANSILADGSSTATMIVQLKDAAGHNLTISGGTVVLTTNKGSISTVTDHLDGSYTAILTSSTLIETAEITGTLDGVDITDQTSVNFVSAIASVATTTITSTASTILANGTTQTTITIQLKDGSGNNLSTGGPIVLLSTTAGSLSSVTDHGDGTYTAILTSTTTLESATISGSLDGVGITDTETVSFIVGPASTATTTIEALSTSILADGSSTTTITVQLKDAAGHNLTTNAGTIVLNTNKGTISGLTYTGNGQYTATLTSSSDVESTVITGTLNGDSITNTENVSFVVGSASAARTQLMVTPLSISANGVSVSTITVRLKDAAGHHLTTSAGMVTLSTTSGTLSSVTDNGDGTYTATLTSATVTGTASITGKLNGTAITDQETVLFVPGPASPANSTISVAAASLKTDGTSSTSITIQLKDAFGNALTIGGANLSLQTSLGSISSITDHGDGTYTAVLTSASTAGTAVISGTLSGVNITDGAQVIFESDVTTPIASMLVVQVDPSVIIADGSSSLNIQIQLKDADGNDITSGGATVQLTTTSGILSEITDHGNGTYSATLTSATVAGTAVITATLSGTELEERVSVTFTSGAPSPATSLISSSTTSIQADGISTTSITIQLKDAFGNLITTGGADIHFSTTSGTLSAVVDNGDGTYAVILTSSTTPGKAIVSSTIGGVAIADQAEITFVALPVQSVLVPTLTADKVSLPADGESTTVITILLEDNSESPVTGASIVLATTAGTLSSVTEVGNGVYTAVLTSSWQEEAAVISASINGILYSQTVSIIFTPVPTPASIFVPEGFSPDGDGINDQFIIEGAEDMKITLIVYNRWGNEVYQASEYKNDWEGLANKGIVIGQKLPDGTYFFVVDLNNGQKPLVKYLTIKRK